MRSKRTPSQIWFKYVMPAKSFYNVDQGVTFDAQLLTLAVETNSARVRLFHENGNLYRSNYDISATQFFEQMQVVPKIKQ